MITYLKLNWNLPGANELIEMRGDILPAHMDMNGKLIGPLEDFIEIPHK